MNVLFIYYLFETEKADNKYSWGEGEGGTKKYIHFVTYRWFLLLIHSNIAKNIIQTPLQKNERKSVRVYLMLCIIVI